MSRNMRETVASQAEVPDEKEDSDKGLYDNFKTTKKPRPVSVAFYFCCYNVGTVNRRASMCISRKPGYMHAELSAYWLYRLTRRCARSPNPETR